RAPRGACPGRPAPAPASRPRRSRTSARRASDTHPPAAGVVATMVVGTAVVGTVAAATADVAGATPGATDARDVTASGPATASAAGHAVVRPRRAPRVSRGAASDLPPSPRPRARAVSAVAATAVAPA